MNNMVERALRRIGEQVQGRISRPGDHRYATATDIYAKPVGPMPCAVAHCRTAEDVQLAVRAARDCDLPLPVRGGGYVGPAELCAMAWLSICGA